MITSKKLLCSVAAFLAMTALTAPVRAETVTQSTTVSQIDIPNAEKIDFSAFDLNHDGILSKAEVGEKLFYVFDLDGNHVIDNIEFKKKTVLTVIPMEKQTITTYDLNGDGKTETTKITNTTFMEQSGLARFAKSPGGLSPADFIGKSFNELDVNKDGVIDIAEWKGAYIASIDEKNKEAARYNH